MASRLLVQANAGNQYVAPLDQFPPEKWTRIPVNQPVVGVSCDAVGTTGDAQNKVRRIINYPSRMAGRVAIQGGLCRREAPASSA